MHDTALGWRLVNPRMAERYSTESMGETAENVAERYAIARDEQDRFALRSHDRAVAAREEGRFADEIVPVDVSREAQNGDPLVAPTRAPRRHLAREAGRAAAGVFREGGTVTAGNASTLNDGAACLVLASAKAEASSGPSRWRASSRSASPASTPPTWGWARCRRPREGARGAGLALDEIDLIEINEAFAAQVLACVGELGIDAEQLNVNGGAIALGHPLGCSGAHPDDTLVWELRRRGARYGLAALCVGVGQGVATIVESGPRPGRPFVEVASPPWPCPGARERRRLDLRHRRGDDPPARRRPATAATGSSRSSACTAGGPSPSTSTSTASSARRRRSSCRSSAAARARDRGAARGEFGDDGAAADRAHPRRAPDRLTEELPDRAETVRWHGDLLARR